MDKIKCAGYVRVSTADQVQDESGEKRPSLQIQEQEIRHYATRNELPITAIYRDEGISGGSVSKRHGLQQCLNDGQRGKFQVLIVYKLSRLGRNARELLDNYHRLSEAGIELRSIKEGIDFSTKYGRAMLGMFAVIAELERDIIEETMLEGRIATGRRGKPVGSSRPYARTYNKETGQWELDENLAQQIRAVAEEYLSGGSLYVAAKRLRMSYQNLVTTLRDRCGDEWIVQFTGQEPIAYKVPRILSDDIISRVRDRLQFNRTSNRTDITEKYLLSGFIRCEKCGKTLSGQTQTTSTGKTFVYYQHQGLAHSDCRAFTSVRGESLENAIMTTIFENFADVPSFTQAIAQSIPDASMISDLKGRIQATEKELARNQKQLDKLVDLALSGTLDRETIRSREASLIQQKQHLAESLQSDRERLDQLPDVDNVMAEAEHLRRMLLEKYSSKDHLNTMTFDEKRTLLHWFFDGRDEKGTPYGIYITKRGQRKDVQIDYFLYGRITGLRTLKGDEIDYQDQYNTNKDNDY